MIFNRKIQLILVICFFLSCGKKDDSPFLQGETTVTNISLSVTQPKGILYVQSDKKTLFTSTGNGGLGEPLVYTAGVDTLTPYSGIPVSINPYSKIKEYNYSVTFKTSGDKYCENMFSFDKESSEIKLNVEGLSGLVMCHTEINAILDMNGNSLPLHNSFDVNVNLTLKAFANESDKFTDYFQYYSNLSSMTDMMNWVKNEMKINPDDASDLSATKFYLRFSPEPNKYNNISLQPLTKIDAITSLQNITGLDLSYTLLQDMRPLVFLKNLEELNLSGNKLSQDDLKIISLPSLKKLIIKDNQISQLKNLVDQFPKLEVLDISNNTKIEDLEEIARLSNLRKLALENVNLAGNNLTKIIRGKNLEALNVSGNKNKVDFSEIAFVKTLKTLSISNVDLSVESLNKILENKNITSLDISKNDLHLLTEEHAVNLAKLVDLKELNISGSRISDNYLSRYFKESKNLSKLIKFVDRNNFDRKTHLTCAESDLNKFYDPSAPLIYLPVSLEYLDVHGNSCLDLYGNIGGTTALDFISNLKNLTHLDISSNGIDNLNIIANLSDNLKPEELIINDIGSSSVLSQETCRESRSSQSPGQLGGTRYEEVCNQLPHGVPKPSEE